MTSQPPPERIVLMRVRGEVERQLLDSGAPEEVHEFLSRHWARLMTDIFMAKGNQDADWQSGWDTMSALLWSLSPKQGRADTTLMLRALPNLLARLQEGCVALGFTQTERDGLFERLAMLHAAVAREGLQAGIGGKTKAEEVTGLSAGDVDITTLPQAILGSAIPPSEARFDRDKLLQDLKVGDLIRLRVGGEDRDLQLNWVSPMRGMFMFTNDQGLDALTLTRARLEAKIRDGDARLLRSG